MHEVKTRQKNIIFNKNIEMYCSPPLHCIPESSPVTLI